MGGKFLKRKGERETFFLLTFFFVIFVFRCSKWLGTTVLKEPYFIILFQISVSLFC